MDYGFCQYHSVTTSCSKAQYDKSKSIMACTLSEMKFKINLHLILTCHLKIKGFGYGFFQYHSVTTIVPTPKTRIRQIYTSTVPKLATENKFVAGVTDVSRQTQYAWLFHGHNHSVSKKCKVHNNPGPCAV